MAGNGKVAQRRPRNTANAKRAGADEVLRQPPALKKILERLSRTGSAARESWEQPFTDPATFRQLDAELIRRQRQGPPVTLSADELHTVGLALWDAAENVEHKAIVVTLLDRIAYALTTKDPRVFRNRMLGLPDKRRRGAVYDAEQAVQAYRDLTERTEADARRPRSADVGEYFRLVRWKSKSWEQCGLLPPAGAKSSDRISLPLEKHDAIAAIQTIFKFRSWDSCYDFLKGHDVRRLPSRWPLV